MIFNQRDLEGYLEIDHRDSPGLTPEQASSMGLRRIADQIGKGQRAQIPTRLCSHCEKMVILNPLRTRERARCWKCWGYLCDDCKAAQVGGQPCRPFAQVIDEWFEQAVKARHDSPSTP